MQLFYSLTDSTGATKRAFCRAVRRSGLHVHVVKVSFGNTRRRGTYLRWWMRISDAPVDYIIDQLLEEPNKHVTLYFESTRDREIFFIRYPQFAWISSFTDPCSLKGKTLIGIAISLKKQ